MSYPCFGLSRDELRLEYAGNERNVDQEMRACAESKAQYRLLLLWPEADSATAGASTTSMTCHHRVCDVFGGVAQPDVAGLDEDAREKRAGSHA